ncbi:hypothetical protein [Microseira wollei]|uniref:Uncharacterized protein n=1 Tax=Microseira wollei NIES-4236 TaxID=2530354 RepID=A0AAV3XNN5_9CYAN|nr:hypothetical protein [Microseira wollei]GET42269.1 hypothetical protein MiSe_70840 [Microseira wollei NIES-4236]
MLNAASGNIEKYIEIYVDVSKLSYPVAKLIGLALFELINDDNKNMGWGTIQRDALAKAARELVAHGVLRSNKNAVNTLNKHFNTPGQDYHKFSRNNTKHMELVHWAIKE